MQAEEFLKKATQAASAAGHCFPEFAACEAALESGWGGSVLASKANNLFGQKQSHPPQGEFLALATREYLNGSWTTVEAKWRMFSDWESCFRERMRILRKLAPVYADYRAALAAASGEQFIENVSKRWSTDPQRARKVLSIFYKYCVPTAPASELA